MISNELLELQKRNAAVFEQISDSIWVVPKRVSMNTVLRRR